MTAPRLDARLARAAAVTLDEIRRSGGPDGQLSSDTFARLKGLPSMLRTSGLVATLAFFAAKRGTDELGVAYDRVLQALWREVGPILSASPVGGRSVLTFFDVLATADPQQLTRATARAAAYSEWLSRLAEALQKEQKLTSSRRSPAPAATPTTTAASSSTS